MADRLETEIAAITPELTPDEVAERVVRLNAYMEKGKSLKLAMEDALFSYIKETGRPVVIGTVRYYIGTPRDTKCRDQAECLQSLVEQFGPKHVGEQFLASGAFKHGAIKREVDAAEFDRLFEVTEREELKEGKPEKVKKLQAVDERFLK